MKMKAAVVYEKDGPFKISEVNIDPPKDDEILVKILAAGICHTDAMAQDQRFPVPLPAVLGHEGAGIVEEVGPKVTEFEKGDLVGLTFGYCGTCGPCSHGKPYACDNMVKINFNGHRADGTHRLHLGSKSISSFFAQSSFAQYAVVNTLSAVKIPHKDVDPAIIAPIGCGIQTGAGTVINQLKPSFGESIAIFGCGAVGMSAIMAARICGAINIIAVGGNEHSLELAKELGATHTINRKKVSSVVDAILEIAPAGADCALDTSGVESMVLTAIKATAYSGRIACAGNCDVTMNVGSDMGNKTLFGVSEGNVSPKIFIPQIIEYYRQGRFPLNKIIKTYSFDEINTAFDDSGKGKVIKAVLKL